MPSVWASSGRNWSLVPWMKPSWPLAGVTISVPSMSARDAVGGGRELRRREPAHGRERQQREELIGDKVVLGRRPGHVRTARPAHP